MPSTLSLCAKPKAKSQNPLENPRIDMDSATPGKPSLQNDMTERRSGLVISRHEHDNPNLTLLTDTSPQGGGFPSLFETVVYATSCRITYGLRGIIESMFTTTLDRLCMQNDIQGR